MLKFIYDTEAEIPASAKTLYAEKDGKWILQVEDAVPKSQLDAFRQKGIDQLKEKDAKLATFEGVDPAKYRDLLAKEKELEEGKLIKKEGLEAAVEKRVAEMKIDYEKRLEAEKKAREEADGALTNMRLDIALRDAGGKLNVRPEAVGDLLLRGRGVLKYVDGKLVAHDESGSKIYGATGDPMTAEEWVGTLTKTAPHLFAESKGGGASGSDGKGGAFTGPNPWSAKTRNLTQQMRITKEDPKLAERLKAAANA